MRDSAVMTLCATIMVLPMSIVYFGTFSLSSLWVNMLVAPLIPWIMLWGFLSIVVYLFHIPTALICTFLAWVALHAIIRFAHWGAIAPGAAVTDISVQ